MNKGYYFAGGKKELGEVRPTDEIFKFNLSKVNRAGVAFRKFCEFQDSPKHATLCVTCLNARNIIVRVERKTPTNTIVEKYIVPGLTTRRIQLDLNQGEIETLSSLTVAVLKEDNFLKRIKMQVSANIKE